MLRATAHYPPREMAVLGLVESVLSFAVMYTVIQAALAPVPASADFDILPRGAIGLAAMSDADDGGVALTAGLYRLEVCLNRKGLVAITGRAVHDHPGPAAVRRRTPGQPADQRPRPTHRR